MELPTHTIIVKHVIMKKAIIKQMRHAALLLFATAGTIMPSSCSDNPEQGGSGSVTPDEEAYTQLTDNAISEFLAFAKNPRPGNTAAKHDNLDKARDYLVNWAKQHNFDVHYDEHPNIWLMFLPTTQAWQISRQ